MSRAAQTARGRHDGARGGVHLLLLLLGALAELGASVLEPNLDASRVELGLGGELLSAVHIRVVGAVEGALELVQLAWRERGSVAFCAQRVEEESGARLELVLAGTRLSLGQRACLRFVFWRGRQHPAALLLSWRAHLLHRARGPLRLTPGRPGDRLAAVRAREGRMRACTQPVQPARRASIMHGSRAYSWMCLARPDCR